MEDVLEMQNVIVAICAYVDTSLLSVLSRDCSGMAKPQTESLDNDTRYFHSSLNLRTSKYSVSNANTYQVAYVYVCIHTTHTHSHPICNGSYGRWQGQNCLFCSLTGYLVSKLGKQWEESQLHKALNMQNWNDKLNPLKSSWFLNLGYFISMKIVKLDFFFSNPLTAPATFITDHFSWYLIISPLCCYLFYGHTSCLFN